MDEAFNIKDGYDFIKINKKSASWAKKKPSKTNILYLTKEEVLSLLDYLLDNIYIKYRSELFRQVIGVPMGTDCAPDLANLFLFAFEYKYVMGLIDTNNNDLMLLRFIYRYIDDLLVLNDRGYFDRIYSNIYPHELELKATMSSNSSTSYLDMDITSHEGKFIHKLYDKRNDFEFKVISLPNLASNIPINQAYGTFYSQVIRYFKANNNYTNFVNDVKCLTDKLCNQNFKRRLLQIYTKTFLRKFDYELKSKFLVNSSMSNFVA